MIATVSSLEGYPIEDYAYRLGRILENRRRKTSDDGVVLLVAPNEQKVWIATGYGAGGFLTDAMSGVIIREDILPHFKQSPPDYGGGIEAGADAIIKQMSLPPDQAQKNLAAAQQAQQQRQDSSGGRLPVVLLDDDHRLRRPVACSAALAAAVTGRRARRDQPVGGPVGPQ